MIGFRSSTAATGTVTARYISAAITVVLSSGSTSGCLSAVDCYEYIYAVDSGAGVVLGVANNLVIDQGSVYTTTVLAGSGADDSSATLYTTATQTSKPVRLLSRIKIQEATAGTWVSDSTEIANWPFNTPAPKATYRSVTTTDSVLTTDETMKLSGSSFTSTLPTAVGVTGKRYKYIHAGTSLTQIYTLATTSSQTIGGVASGSYILYTAGETLELVSDGSNWQIENHYAQTAWASYTPTYTGYGTVSTTYVFWRRNGPDLEVEGSFTAGTPTAVEARISFPGSCPNTTAGITIGVAGVMTRAQVGAATFYMLREVSIGYFTASIQYASGGGYTKATGSGMFAAADTLSFKGAVPIVGFQP